MSATPRVAGAMAGIAALVMAAACASRSTPGTPPPPSAPTAAPSDALVQQWYESGRYDEIVSSVSASAAPDVGAEALWLAAHSHLRLGRRDQAAGLLVRLGTGDAAPHWQVTSQLALAGVDGNADAADAARQAATAFPTDPSVQYELGLTFARDGDFAAAAQAFERTIAADPTFAYAYYYAGLAYDRVRRADLMVMRFDTFLRLAPQAPERPEVESILRTVRAR